MTPPVQKVDRLRTCAPFRKSLTTLSPDRRQRIVNRQTRIQEETGELTAPAWLTDAFFSPVAAPDLLCHAKLKSSRLILYRPKARQLFCFNATCRDGSYA